MKAYRASLLWFAPHDGTTPRALFEEDGLLVLGAGGGCGIAGVEIGKAMGARVVAAASSDAKLALAKSRVDAAAATRREVTAA